MFRAAHRATRAPASEPPGPTAAPSRRDAAAAALRLELLPTATASDGRAAWHVADGLAAALLATPAAPPVPATAPEARHSDANGNGNGNGHHDGDGRAAPASRPVHADELLAWGLGREEAFHLASANVRGAALPSVTEHAPSGGAELLFVSGADATTSAHALWLDDLVEGIPAAGALVAVPQQRAVLAHRLTRFDHAVEAVNLLVIMADAAWREGAAPVSADLYWWYDGWFTSLEARLVDDDVRVAPPAAFLEALERLPRL